MSGSYGFPIDAARVHQIEDEKIGRTSALSGVVIWRDIAGTKDAVAGRLNDEFVAIVLLVPDGWKYGLDPWGTGTLSDPCPTVVEACAAADEAVHARIVKRTIPADDGGDSCL